MSGENNNEELDLSLELSDDEAPEEMSFESARNEALRRVKSALETARREKEQLKQKRRRRQEMFQEQKKAPPSQLLDQMDSAAPQEPEQSQDPDQEEPEEERITASRSLTETYTVTTAQHHKSFQLQTAQDFLQSRLYGAGSRRSTNNELLSLQNKKDHTNRPLHISSRTTGLPKKRLKQRSLNSAGSTSRRPYSPVSIGWACSRNSHHR
ncbi:hypothetical protein WMY93_000689 [Mugilogobius chulae]|uniref:U3 small nucleolar RNA-associated protein NOL7 C-terminal domain-containing protein n=1 Tax=Mugilogobius chulae TaxID=88201 RepID=A0AAW0Q009_9GOBI